MDRHGSPITGYQGSSPHEQIGRKTSSLFDSGRDMSVKVCDCMANVVSALPAVGGEERESC